MALVVLMVILAIPAIEIGIFLEVGGRIGVWPTIGGILLTAAIGMALFRYQGLSILRRLRETMERREAPVVEAFDGVGLLLAGLLLFLPGFMTDAIGFLLFIPPLRIILLALLFRNMVRKGTTTHVWTARGGHHAHSETIIEADFVDTTAREPANEDRKQAITIDQEPDPDKPGGPDKP